MMTVPTRVRDALAAMAADWYGYAHSPIPSPVDDLAAVVVDEFARASDETDRATLRALLANSHSYVLQNFAVRMAALAVRQRSADTLRRALFAIALVGGSPGADRRDLPFALPPLQDAAWRIGADRRRLFGAAAQLAEPQTARLLRRAGSTWWGRWRRLDSFRARFWRGWSAGERRDGFGYLYMADGKVMEPGYGMRQIEQARRIAAAEAAGGCRFRVAHVFSFKLIQRVVVVGEVLEGRIRAGETVRAPHLDPAVEWKVAGIAFAGDDPALLIEDLRPLDELRRLLPPESILVSGAFDR